MVRVPGRPARRGYAATVDVHHARAKRPHRRFVDDSRGVDGERKDRELGGDVPKAAEELEQGCELPDAKLQVDGAAHVQHRRDGRSAQSAAANVR